MSTPERRARASSVRCPSLVRRVGLRRRGPLPLSKSEAASVAAVPRLSLWRSSRCQASGRYAVPSDGSCD